MKSSASRGETLRAFAPYSMPMKSVPSPIVTPLSTVRRCTAVMSRNWTRIRRGPERAARTPSCTTYPVPRTIHTARHRTAAPKTTIGQTPNHQNPTVEMKQPPWLSRR